MDKVNQEKTGKLVGGGEEESGLGEGWELAWFQNGQVSVCGGAKGDSKTINE